MNKEKRQALEEAGFILEDAEDFLELTAEERQLVELRISMSRAVRARRIRQRLTQQQFARRLKSSQSRVAKMEAGSPDVSLDLMFKGFFALGGTVKDLRSFSRPNRPRRAKAANAPGGQDCEKPSHRPSRRKPQMV
jgi:DNA-binding transcriptional regulator YiaG